MNYSESKRFFMKGGPHGFGYAIVDKGVNKDTYKTLFHTSDGEQAKKVFENIEVNHTEFPEPKTDWTPKVLVIKEKHGDCYYLVKNAKELNKIAFEYIQMHHGGKYSQFVKWDVPENLEVIDETIINSCPSVQARELMIQNNKKNKNTLKSYTEHNELIDKVDSLMANKSIKGAYELLFELEFLYSYIDLETFSNYRHH